MTPTDPRQPFLERFFLQKLIIVLVPLDDPSGRTGSSRHLIMTISTSVLLLPVPPGTTAQPRGNPGNPATTCPVRCPEARTTETRLDNQTEFKDDR